MPHPKAIRSRALIDRQLLCAAIAVVLSLPATVSASEPRQVLVASSASADLPTDARHVALLAGLRFSTVPVPRGHTAAQYAAVLSRSAGIRAVQQNAPIRRASIAGTCVDAPSTPRLEIPSVTTARSRPLPATTRPIAVLDTGVDPAVPEFGGRVRAPSDATGGSAGAARDDDGHGTQVAAAAAAAPGLVAGVSPTSPILPVRIAGVSQLATPESIVRGLEVAVTRRARVAVLPSSQPLAQTSDTAVTAVGLAVNAAFDAGVIVVVPVGNEGRGDRVFPGGLAHLLTVGSSGPLAVRDPFSNFGPWVDVVAPGADLVLPAPKALCPTGYAAAEGTSFSAGAVAGAVALIAAARPGLGTTRLYDLVRRRSAVEAGLQGFDVNTGFGLLSVAAGLTAPVPANDPHELNDNVYWLKRRPAAFPTYLRRTRRTTTRGSVSPAKDPQDAFKVYLSRNDVLRARVKSTDSSALLYASVWARRTGPFDMRLPAPSTELRNSAGFTQSPVVSYRAPRSGTYYVTIFAPDLRVPSDPSEPREGLIANAPPKMPYALTMDKRCSRSRTLRVPLGRLRRPGARMNSLTVYVDAIPRARRAAIARRITLRGLRRGRHRIVYRATFAAHRRTSSATAIRVKCSLRLSK